MEFITARHGLSDSPCERDNMIYTAEYIGHSLELAGSDPMGRILAGQITLRCHLRPSGYMITQRGHPYEQFDRRQKCDVKTDVRGSWYCMLAYHDRYQKSVYDYDLDERHGKQRGHIMGLILKRSQERAKTSRRIGCFIHPWTVEGTRHYPEFADVVGPQSLEREEITII